MQDITLSWKSYLFGFFYSLKEALYIAHIKHFIFFSVTEQIAWYCS